MSCAFRERATALHWTANAIREIVRPAEQSEDCVQSLRLFVEQAPVSLGMFGHDMRYLATSSRWKSDRGLDGENLSGRFHCDLFPQASKRWRDIYKRAFSGETLREELDLTTRLDGGFQWMSWEIWPWRTPAGETGGILMLTEYLRANDCAANGNAGEWLLPFGAGQSKGPCTECEPAGKDVHPEDFLSHLAEMIAKMALIESSLSGALNKAKAATGSVARPAWTALDRQTAMKKARTLAAKAAAVARDAVLLGTLLDTAGRERRGRSLN
jgi:PAS domain S-box-containing protein